MGEDASIIAGTTPSFWYVYGAIDCVLFVSALILFIKCLSLRVNRVTSLTLFALVLGNTMGYAAGFIVEGRLLENITKLTPTELVMYTQTLIFLTLFGAGCQDAIVIYLPLMWIELFATFRAPNLEKQYNITKRFAITRFSLIFFVIAFEMLTTGLPAIYEPTNVHTKVYTQVIGSLIDLFFYAPFIILGIVRWRDLYVGLKDLLATNSRIAPRFKDLTIVTAIAFFCYIVNLVQQLVNFQYFNGQANVIFWFFLSMLPHILIMTSVMYFFSPVRQRQREETQITTSELSGTPTTLPEAPTKTTSTGAPSDELEPNTATA